MGKGLLGKFNLAVEFIYKQCPEYSVKKMTAQKKNLFSLFRVDDEER